MKIDENIEKLWDLLNSKADIGDLCNVNILEVSQLMDALIMEHYRNQEIIRKRTKKQAISNNKVCRL